MESPREPAVGAGTTHPGADRALPLTGIWLGMLGLAAASLTALAASGDGYPWFSAGRVAFWWLASMILVLVTAAWIDASDAPSRVAISRWPGWKTAAAWLGIALLAALPRLLVLDRFPTVVDADGAAFMMLALEFRQGNVVNPFGTGWFTNPTLYPVAQSLVADAVGDGVAAHRTLSALMGTIGVLATWRLGIRVVGPLAAAIGAVLLASWPLHLQMSRVALNNITDPTFLVLAILFLLRALEQRRRRDAVICGFALAFGLYGYFGGRAFWLVVVVLLVLLGAISRAGARAFLSILAWMAAGFVAAAMPLLAAFWREPGSVAGHMGMVTSLSFGAFRSDPVGSMRLYIPNLLDAVAYPLAGNDVGHFRHDPPYIGWPLAILLIAGVVMLIRDAVMLRKVDAPVVLGVPYLLLAGGIAFTIPIAGQRYLALTPLLALVCGAGLVAIVDLVSRLVPEGRRWGPVLPMALLLVTVSALGVANLRWLASEDRQLETYGDLRTTMMWDLGWRIREGDGGVTRVLIVGAPYVYSYGFANLTFLAPDLVQEDVPGQFVAGMGAPPLQSHDVLVLVPERAGERCVIENAYPGATVAEVHGRDGSLLYIAFFPEGAKGFATGETPAETALELQVTSSCELGG